MTLSRLMDANLSRGDNGMVGRCDRVFERIAEYPQRPY